MSTKTFVGALLLICVVVVVGRSVDPAAVTTFESGSAALASDMNGNFQELIDAINDNAARIENLERGGTGCTTEELIAGSTYQLLVSPQVLGVGGWTELRNIRSTYTFDKETTENDEIRTVRESGSSRTSYAETNLGGAGFIGEFSDEFADREDATWEIMGGELRVWEEGEIAFTGSVSVDGNLIVVQVAEALDPPEEGIDPPLAPDERHMVGTAVLIKVARKPIVQSVDVVSEESTETTLTLRVHLADEGSGPLLEFGWTSGVGAHTSPPEHTVWQRSDTFVIERETAEISWGTFWARRGCNSDFLSDPVGQVINMP